MKYIWLVIFFCVTPLGHQPYHLDESEHNGIDFQFSGHTHHGQLCPASTVRR